MSTLTKREDDDIARGQAKFLQHLHGGLSGVALRCAMEFDIASIINNHDGPITLSQIAHKIGSPSMNFDGLSRLMKFLVHKQIFDEVRRPEHEEPLYSLNHCSKFLLPDTSNTLAPLARMITEPLLFSAMYSVNKSIAMGGSSIFHTYGVQIWDFISLNPHLNSIFNEAMACFTKVTMDAIMPNYTFDSVKGTLVDIGGGIGVALNEIVTAYPHLKGINFDSPQVISTAPIYEGITHVGGDMFTSIPQGDSFFIKSVLHDWCDEKCVQILKNCRESMIDRTGKVIILDIVINRDGDEVFDDARIDYDMIMLATEDGGKERTQVEWKKILEEAGFFRHNIIKVPTIVSIIEAYLE